MAGRTVVVTGATSGIGLATARALGAANARVVLAVRNTTKGQDAASSIAGDAIVAHLDLSDLRSIRQFAEEWQGPIDVLINNAGISVPTLERTVDGFEMQFGTNHLGPFALTNLLLPHIRSRVVSLSSQAERMAKLDLDDLNWDRTPYRNRAPTRRRNWRTFSSRRNCSGAWPLRDRSSRPRPPIPGLWRPT